MIHLFNKVYLKHEHQYNKRRDCILLSSLYAYGTMTTFQDQMKDNADYGTLFYAAQNYNELILSSFNNDETAFLNVLFNYQPTDRLVIYCNTNDFIILTAKFFKTLLPNLTADSFYNLMRLTLARMAYLFGCGFLSFVKIPKTATTDYKNMKFIDRQAIDVLWNTLQPWNLSDEQRNVLLSSCGVEFQLATYMVDPSYPYVNNLEQRLIKIIKKEIIHDFVLDVKAGILLNLEMLQLLEPSSNFNIMTSSLEEFVNTYPQYKFLTDNQFTPENIDYIYANYNLESLGVIRDNVLSKTYRYYQKLTPFYKQTFSLNDILSYELTTIPTTTVIGDKGEYEEKINTYVVDYFLDLYRTNPSMLNFYTIL